MPTYTTDGVESFNDLVGVFDAWLADPEAAGDAHDAVDGFSRRGDSFWTDIDVMFSAATEDAESPIHRPDGVDYVLAREYNGDGYVESCHVLIYTTDRVKLATKAMDERDLCTEHDEGRAAAAEALATIVTEIRKTVANYEAARTAPTGQTAPDPAAALIAYAEQTGISDGALDEDVHDVASRQASGVNNSGTATQIRFLVEHLGVAEVESTLRELAAE